MRISSSASVDTSACLPTQEHRQEEPPIAIGTVQYTVCPRSSDPVYIVTYYIEWVNTSWTDGNKKVKIYISWKQVTDK